MRILQKVSLCLLVVTGLVIAFRLGAIWQFETTHRPDTVGHDPFESLARSKLRYLGWSIAESGMQHADDKVVWTARYRATPFYQHMVERYPGIQIIAAEDVHYLSQLGLVALVEIDSCNIDGFRLKSIADQVEWAENAEILVRNCPRVTTQTVAEIAANHPKVSVKITD